MPHPTIGTVAMGDTEAAAVTANPEHIARFMVEGTELFLDGTFDYENGSLTYRAMNGLILSPSVLREKKGQQQ